MEFLGSGNASKVLPVANGGVDQTAWAAWTPTLGGITLGNGTLACKYKSIGKTTFFIFSLTIGGTTSFAGAFTFTLPSTGVATTTGLQVGAGKIWNHSNGDLWDMAGIKTSTTVVSLYALYTGLSKSFMVNSIFPMTLTAGETLTLSGFYEAA